MRNRNGKVTTVRRRGQTMIALMITVVILIALTLAFLGSRRGDDGEIKPSVAKASIDRSQEIVLQSNLNNLHQIIGMYKSDNDGKPPADLEEVKRIAKSPAEIFINPVDKQPLGYDPTTGLMIVKPYEGMSPMITKLITASARNADQGGAAPGAPPAAPPAPALAPGTGPGGVRMPEIPNSGSAQADDSE